MHELSLANQIVEIVLETARQQGFSRILSVQVKVGKLMAVETDNLLFGLDVIKKSCSETQATVFQVIEEPVQLSCKDCGETTTLDGWVFACKWCDSRSVDVIAGESMEVIEMEVV